MTAKGNYTFYNGRIAKRGQQKRVRDKYMIQKGRETSPNPYGTPTLLSSHFHHYPPSPRIATASPQASTDPSPPSAPSDPPSAFTSAQNPMEQNPSSRLCPEIPRHSQHLGLDVPRISLTAEHHGRRGTHGAEERRVHRCICHFVLCSKSREEERRR